MPQFWLEDFAPQLVWLAISFVILYLLMARVALPRVADALEQRQERIATDLDQAQAMKDQAEKVLAEYDAALAEARGQAQLLMAEASAAAAAEAERRHAEVGERLAREASEAADRIEAAKQQALGEVKELAADLAGDVAQKLIGSGPTRGDVQTAVERAMQEVR